MTDKSPKVYRMLRDHIDADLTDQTDQTETTETTDRIRETMQQMADRILKVEADIVDLGQEEGRMMNDQDLDHMRAAIQALDHAARHLGAVAWGVDVTEWTIPTDHLFR